MYNFIT